MSEAAKRPRTTTVVAGVKRDLAELGRRDPSLEGSALAAAALALARELDKPLTAATAKAACARALAETLARLRSQVPAGEQSDRVDELGKRRAERGAGA